MARGDECKTASKANNACKQFDVSAPIKKPVYQASSSPAPKKQDKTYGSWGPVYKDKKTFTDMHFC